MAQNQLQSPFPIGTGKDPYNPISSPVKRRYRFHVPFERALPFFLILGIAWPNNYRLNKIMTMGKENNKTSLC